MKEGKEEILVHEIGFEKSTQQLIISRDRRPLGRLSRINVGIDHLRSVEGRLVQSTIVGHVGRELGRRRPVPFGVEALAIDQRRRVSAAGGPEEVGDVEHVAQAVVIASLGADRQLEQQIARVDVAHDLVDGDSGTDAAHNLVHFGLGAEAKQLVELFVDAALVLLRVELAPQRLAACLGWIRIVDALGAAQFAAPAGWPLGVTLDAAHFVIATPLQTHMVRTGSPLTFSCGMAHKQRLPGCASSWTAQLPRPSWSALLLGAAHEGEATSSRSRFRLCTFRYKFRYTFGHTFRHTFRYMYWEERPTPGRVDISFYIPLRC